LLVGDGDVLVKVEGWFVGDGGVLVQVGRFFMIPLYFWKGFGKVLTDLKYDRLLAEDFFCLDLSVQEIIFVVVFGVTRFIQVLRVARVYGLPFAVMAFR
jgi:hypothetical protein